MVTRLMMLGAALLGASCSQAPSTPAISVTDVWARATAPGQSSGAVYATIVNRGSADDRLVAVSSTAGTAMLHANESSGGIVRMRMLSDLPIPAGGRVTLAPGATHIMLSGLPQPLTAGDDLQLRLRFAAAGEQSVRVAIVAPGSR